SPGPAVRIGTCSLPGRSSRWSCRSSCSSPSSGTSCAGSSPVPSKDDLAGWLEVLTGPGAARLLLAPGLLGWDHPGRKLPAHRFELVLREHLLGHERGLDPVEQALQPADELRMRDPDLRLGGSLREGEHDPVDLLGPFIR